MDNRLILAPSHILQQSQIKKFCLPDFYQGIQLESVEDHQWLGFTIDAPARTATLNLPTKPWQVRSPASAGSWQLAASGFLSSSPHQQICLAQRVSSASDESGAGNLCTGKFPRRQCTSAAGGLKDVHCRHRVHCSPLQVHGPRPRPSSAPPARPPRFLRDREEDRGYTPGETSGEVSQPYRGHGSPRQRAGLSMQSNRIACSFEPSSSPRPPMPCPPPSFPAPLPAPPLGPGPVTLFRPAGPQLASKILGA